MGLDFSCEIQRDIDLDQLAEMLARASAQYPAQMIRPESGRPRVVIAGTHFDLYRQSDMGMSADLVQGCFGFRPATGFVTKLFSEEGSYDVDDLIDLCVELMALVGGDAILHFLSDTPVVLFRDGGSS
jgi:hypothetical protein